MELKLYNTLTNQKETFNPINPGEVGIYNCGVTVYDQCHLGHARGAINFDVMRNLFKALDYKVVYVKNYTDIDDKMINRANERGISLSELAAENIKSHDDDMASLGIGEPDIAPRATDYISEMIEMIEILMKKEFAYQTEEGVFFRVKRFERYGRLSGKNIDDLQSGARVAVDESKEDPLDFALWKAAKPGEPAWESPWGKGRPGWHMECSVMSKAHLGETFDIHAGGGDLIFPHHENEIAQSECANGKPYANCWLHNGMIKIENQKMSKSLGNFATISDLVKKYHPELIRFFILSAQYRQSLDFSHDALLKSAEGLDRIYRALERHESGYTNNVSVRKAQGEFGKVGDLREKFFKAMTDDLNTPLAISVLFDLSKILNSVATIEPFARDAWGRLKELGGVLGILKVLPQDWFKTPRIRTEDEGLSDRKIEELIQERIRARTEKNWGRADEIRDLLIENFIQLEDRDGQTIWRRK